jgi:hypothetical protein
MSIKPSLIVKDNLVRHLSSNETTSDSHLINHSFIALGHKRKHGNRTQ